MKHIQKTQEPQVFADWKDLANPNWQPTYGDLRGAEKEAVLSSLLKEQGYLCCYCGRRIGKADSHIEHLIPQAADPLHDLDYGNLLGSCLRETKVNDPLHCGHARGNDLLPITPLQADCETRFRFTNDGQIKPTEDSDNNAEVTIGLLGLNIEKLQAMRRRAIRFAFQGIDALDPNEKARMRNAFERRDAQDRYAEFCIPILYVLENDY